MSSALELIDWTPTQDMRKYDIDVWNTDDTFVSLPLSNCAAEEILRVHDMILDDESLQNDSAIANLISLNTVLTELCTDMKTSVDTLGAKAFFLKMHHSPKDALYEDIQNRVEGDEEEEGAASTIPLEKYHQYMRCVTPTCGLVRLLKSARIADDLRSGCRMVFFCAWNDRIEPCNEFRVFGYRGTLIGASKIPNAAKDSTSTTAEIYNAIWKTWYKIGPLFGSSGCAIDIAVDGQHAIVIEVNPLDCETDLFWFTREEMQNEYVRRLHTKKENMIDFI